VRQRDSGDSGGDSAPILGGGAVRECTVCPEFVVRCGHLGERRRLFVWKSFMEGGFFIVSSSGAAWRPTRAEADAEFARREAELLEPPP
jgi:hypothetical protein